MTKQHRHSAAKERNTLRMQAEQIPFTPSNEGETLLVRTPWAAADFYPSTGTFRDVATQEVHKNKDFFEWYRRKAKAYVPPPEPVVTVRQGTGSRRRYYIVRTTK